MAKRQKTTSNITPLALRLFVSTIVTLYIKRITERNMAKQGSGGNVIAAICNIFIPGLGQLVQGRLFSALLFFITTATCYALSATIILFFMWIVGAIVHLWSIIDAARYSN